MNIHGMGGRLTAVMDERAIIDQPAGLGAPLHFRYIAMHGTGCDERRAWVDQLAASHERLDFGSNPDILTSRAGTAFDFVVFGGEDAPRLARFMRDHGAMWHDKPKLCVCLRSQPEQRARLLTAGFDDVVDVRRIAPAEFLARAQAILRRYDGARARRQQAGTALARLGEVCQVAALSARQRIIVRRLIEAPGAMASSYALRLAACRRGEDMSQESLKTMISCIRKHLRAGYRIVAQVPSTYRLVMPGTA